MSSKNAPARTEEQKACEAYWTQLLADRAETIGWGRDKRGDYIAGLAKDAWSAWQRAFTRGADAGPVPLFTGTRGGPLLGADKLSEQIAADRIAEGVESVLDEVVALFSDHALETWDGNATRLPADSEIRETLRVTLTKTLELLGKDRDTTPKR